MLATGGVQISILFLDFNFDRGHSKKDKLFILHITVQLQLCTYSCYE